MAWPYVLTQATYEQCRMLCWRHSTMLDENPQHGRCPVGRDSWCFYQKALATGQEPGLHRVNVHTPLSAEMAQHVKPVYTRLAHDDLLIRCLLGKTQNVNESLHSKVWTKCPKTNFVYTRACSFCHMQLHR